MTNPWLDSNGASPLWFAKLLAAFPRIAIAGAPRAGKTSLAATVTDRPVFGSDDLISLPWANVPRALIGKSTTMGRSWVMEGVQVARALRKGLQPDAVVYLTKQHGAVTARQVGMGRAVATVFEQWAARNARVTVVRHP